MYTHSSRYKKRVCTAQISFLPLIVHSILHERENWRRRKANHNYKIKRVSLNLILIFFVHTWQFCRILNGSANYFSLRKFPVSIPKFHSYTMADNIILIFMEVLSKIFSDIHFSPLSLIFRNYTLQYRKKEYIVEWFLLNAHLLLSHLSYFQDHSC